MKPKKTTRGNWYVTMSLAGVTVAYITLWYLPGRKAMSEMRLELAIKQQTVAGGKQVEEELRQSHKRLEHAQAYVARWSDRVASRTSGAPVFGQMNAVARAAGATTTRFEPAPVVEFDALRQLPLTMACSGSFSQIYQLLKSLEDLPRLVWIEDLRLERKAESDKELRCELKLAVFVDKLQNSN